MVSYAGLDVSLETVAVCVVDGDGAGLWRGKCVAEPEAIAVLLAHKAPGLARVTLETGALSGWLYRELRRRDVPVVCVDARHAKAVLMQRLNKTDAIDAQGLAELARVGWFKAVQPKSEPAQLVATLIAARSRLIKMRADLVSQIRGLLKPFGLRPGKVHGATLAARVRELIAARGLLEEVILRLLQLWDDLQRQIVALHQRLLTIVQGTAPAGGSWRCPGSGRSRHSPSGPRSTGRIGSSTPGRLGLVGAHATAPAVGSDRPAGTHLQARRPTPAQLSVRGGHDHALPPATSFGPAQLGAGARQAARPQAGRDRRRPQARGGDVAAAQGHDQLSATAGGHRLSRSQGTAREPRPTQPIGAQGQVTPRRRMRPTGPRFPPRFPPGRTGPRMRPAAAATADREDNLAPDGAGQR